MRKLFKGLSIVFGLAAIAALITCPARVVSVPLLLVCAGVFWLLSRR